MTINVLRQLLLLLTTTMSSSSDSDAEPESAEKNGFVNQYKELRFVFDTIDVEDLPLFNNWQDGAKIVCALAFQPTQTRPGPTTVYSLDMEPVKFFHFFYNDETDKIFYFKC